MEKLDLVKALTLEYRLSLENVEKICQVLQIKLDDESIKDKMFEKCKSKQEKDAMKFLFNQTAEETQNVSRTSFIVAYNALKQMGNNKTILYKTDNDFKNLIFKKKKLQRLTVEEIIVIMKYRLKYAISIDDFCYSYGLSSDTIYRYEKKISENCSNDKEFGEKYSSLLRKIENLNDNYRTLHNASVYKQKIKRW